MTEQALCQLILPLLPVVLLVIPGVLGIYRTLKGRL
jgi:hypothetical protein